MSEEKNIDGQTRNEIWAATINNYGAAPVLDCMALACAYGEKQLITDMPDISKQYARERRILESAANKIRRLHK
jgi:hypothetical protein